MQQLSDYLSESFAKTIAGLVVDIRPDERGASVIAHFENGSGSAFATTSRSVVRDRRTPHGRVRVTVEVLP